MLRNYLNVSTRRLARNPGTTFINVFGLALGLSATLLIGLFIRDELSYDRSYPDTDRIYRVTTAQTSTQTAPQSSAQSDASANVPTTERIASTFLAVAPAVRESVPDVELAVRLNGNALNSTLVSSADEQFYVDGIFSADAGVFDLFGIDLLQGNPATALERPNTAVLSAGLAEKYFGDADPVGQSLSFYGADYEVTGVMRAMPPNTHVHFDLLSSMATSDGQDWWKGHEWGLLGFYTYVRLREGADPDAVAARIAALSVPIDPENVSTFPLQPVSDIHLRSHLDGELEANGDIRYVWLFGSVALLVFLIACVNYMNLATALSSRRASEIGVRKAVGAGRREIVGLLLSESVVTAGAALLLSAVLIEAALPWFNNLTGKLLDMDYAREGLLLVAAALGAGLIAGSYPAVILSRFRPIRALRGALIESGRDRGAFRKLLVVFQFTVSIALITATIVVQRQLDYVQQERIGFDKEHLVALHSTKALGESYEAFKNTLEAEAGIASVTTATNVPGHNIFNEYGMKPDEDRGLEQFYLTYNTVDFDFVRTMGLEVVAGRDLSPAFGTDLDKAILVNETTVRKMGWDTAVGQKLFGRDVVGVVGDYLTVSSRDAVKPSAFTPSAAVDRYVVLRLSPAATPDILDTIDRVWTRFVPEAPLNFSFVDADVEALYRSEQRLGKVFVTFSLLAILIACLGLFGLAAFAAERRTKEIGIRKVLGASVGGIVALLSREFVLLVVVALAVGGPLAWFGMQRWLEDYAYRIELGVAIPIAAGAIAMVIALATVCFQATRAALADPVRSLRSE